MAVSYERGTPVWLFLIREIPRHGRADTFAEATRVGHETRKEINKLWKLLELGLDGIYCPFLLLNKKKYAAIALSERDGVVTKVRPLHTFFVITLKPGVE